MREARSTVRLAEGVPFDVSTRGVTASLRRSEIEQAARSAEGSVELMLDVRRGQGADVEAHSLAVEWSQADLERLIREAENADELVIAFDRDEMVVAIDAETDVEAHGLRDKALVLTVVAVSALSTAGAAQAMPAPPGPSDAGPVVSAAAPALTQSPATTIGGAGASIAASDASPATTIGGAGPTPTAAPIVSSGATASSETRSQVEVRGEAASRTLPSGVGDSSTGFGGEAAVIGAAGLAIVAAGFAAAGTRRKSVRPA